MAHRQGCGSSVSTINSKGIDFTGFWLSNQKFIKRKITPTLIEKKIFGILCMYMYIVGKGGGGGWHVKFSIKCYKQVFMVYPRIRFFRKLPYLCILILPILILASVSVLQGVHHGCLWIARWRHFILPRPHPQLKLNMQLLNETHAS